MDLQERITPLISDLIHLIENHTGDIYGNSLDSSLRLELTNFAVGIRNNERNACILVVKSHYHSFDNDYYVCYPPQDVISDILASLEETK